MASSSSLRTSWPYDVYLSFKGKDMPTNFLRLYEGLRKRGIFSFLDDDDVYYDYYYHNDDDDDDAFILRNTRSYFQRIPQAMEEFQVALVVFSKNYATSRRCWDHLVKIMECNQKKELTVIPIFYGVDQADVQRQRGRFAEAFAKHEKWCKSDEEMDEVKRWRSTLTQVANLSGCVIHDRTISKCIPDLIDQISSKLLEASLTYFPNVVGIETHLKEVGSLLEMEIDDVWIVGIWGVGGVGKTTIAKAVFDRLSSQFDGACFLADIKENKHGMHSLQNILLSELLREKTNYVNSKEDGKHLIAHRLRFKKVLVVLDDIDHKDHLDYLVGDLGWFGNGSRIIATTRDKQIMGKDNVVYEVTTLVDHEAIHLFNQYAFRGKVLGEFFVKLALEVVIHAKGLPLVLKVLGSFLHKKDMIVWRTVVNQIKRNTNSNFVENLKISYDGLDHEEKEIFLDITCFLRGRKKKEILQILESCGFGVDIGLKVLIDKSLVFISEYDTIQMHDLIQEMGRYIVKMQKDPGKRSRIWDAGDCEEVIINNTGTEEVEAIWLTCFERRFFNEKAMKNMQRLRILYICDDRLTSFSSDPSLISLGSVPWGSNGYLPNNLRWFVWKHFPWESLPENFEPKSLVHLDLRGSSLWHLWMETKGTKAMEAIWFRYDEKICFSNEAMENMETLRILYIWSQDCSPCHDGSIQYLPNNLRWFVWNHFPWESLPDNFEPKRLVHLQLCFSSLRYLWTGIKHFLYLRTLDLSRSRDLMQTPDFTEMSNLEYLDLGNCINLEEVHHSLGCPTKLKRLNLIYCRRLKRFPCVNVESLEYLDLKFCSRLEKFPEICGRTRPNLKITMCDSEIRELPSYIVQCLTLRHLDNLVALPSSIGMLKGLVILDVSNCYKLESLPEELGDLVNLEKVDASGTLISRPPSSIVCLNKLTFMSFAKQRYNVSLEEGMYLAFPQVNEGLRSLEDLDLSYCNLKVGGLPEDIGSLSSLKELNFTGNNFEHLPGSVAQLGALRSLDLKECKRLEELPDFMGMPNLMTLNLSIINIEHLPQSINQLGALRSLDLSYCKRLKELPSFMGMQNLETLNLSNCINLEEVHHSLGFLKKLCTLKLTNCKRLKRFPALCIDSLEYLCLRDCSSLEKIPEILGNMKVELEIHMLDSVIRALGFRGFENLATLPSSICKLKSLISLNVSDCSKLKSFPEEIGDLENLENLDARGTLISQLPSSIVQLNKLKFLSFAKQNSGGGLVDGVYFVFPQVNEGLCSLEHLDLSYCNLMGRGLPEDIGCLHSLKELYLCGNNFEHLPRSIAQLGALRSLDLSDCKRLKELPGFRGMQNLETLNMSNCMNLEEVHHSLEFLKKLCSVKLTNCKRLKRFPVLCIDSLEYLNLERCSSLEIFPEILGSMNLKLKSGLRCLDLRGLENLVTLPSSICKLKNLVELNVSACSKLESLPKEMGDLENLEWLDAKNTLISQPPPSIVCLNKLHFLQVAKQKSEVGLKIECTLFSLWCLMDYACWRF